MTKRSFQFTPRLVVGILIVIFGFALLLETLDILDVGQILGFWFPALLFAFGIRTLRLGRLEGWFFIALGSWLALHQVGLIPWGFGDIWPVVLIFVGGTLIWQALQGPRSGGSRDVDSTFDTVAIWSGIERKISSSHFKAGEAIAFMGSCDVDLRQSFIADGEAELFAFAMWGGVDILVPEDWAVTNQGVGFLGGFSDESQPPRGGSEQRLVVRGLAVMGSVQILNHKASKR